jgi:putative membrane protein
MFTPQDLIKVREAVKQAEHRTSGEIVPMIVPASALYREARHRAGLSAALIVLALLITMDMRWQLWWWSRHAGGWTLLGAVVAYALGYWFGRTTAGIYLFVSTARMDMKVRRRAESAFHEHGLHRTRNGTGILIMVSLLERRVQVLADQGINARVPVGTWTLLVQRMLARIHEGQPTVAFCEAIATCGAILAEHFPSREGDNPDELPNDMIEGR